MVCLKCGYCCIYDMVVIIDDPEKGVIESNMVVKSSGKRCKHLRGSEPGKYSCVVHDYPWYKRTPCFAYGQIESRVDDVCRMGEYVINKRSKQL